MVVVPGPGGGYVPYRYTTPQEAGSANGVRPFDRADSTDFHEHVANGPGNVAMYETTFGEYGQLPMSGSQRAQAVIDEHRNDPAFKGAKVSTVVEVDAKAIQTEIERLQSASEDISSQRDIVSSELQQLLQLKQEILQTATNFLKNRKEERGYTSGAIGQ
jgi:hypothetical protein